MLEHMSSTVFLGVGACEVSSVKCLRPYQRLLLQTNLVKSSSRRGYYETIYQSLLRYLSPRAAHDKRPNKLSTVIATSAVCLLGIKLLG